MLAQHGLQYWGLGSWTNGCAAMHHPPDDAADGSTGAALHCEFSLPVRDPTTWTIFQQDGLITSDCG